MNPAWGHHGPELIRVRSDATERNNTSVMCRILTYDSSRLCRLDERQCAVVSLLGDVDEALLELVLLEDAVELIEKTHPLVSLLVTVS